MKWKILGTFLNIIECLVNSCESWTNAFLYECEFKSSQFSCILSTLTCILVKKLIKKVDSWNIILPWYIIT